MSTISNRHTVTSHISGKSQALTGQRLAKVTYKTTSIKVGEKWKQAVCASIPMLSNAEITENIESLLPYIREFMETAQDKIFRSLYENSLGSLKEISDTDIGISGIIGYLSAESSGSRMTKELLEKWFDDTISDSLLVLFALKRKYIISPDNIEEITEDQFSVLGKDIKGYKDMVSALSGGKTMYSESQCKQLLFALNKCDAGDDIIGAKLVSKLEVMRDKKPVEELMSLLEE